MRRVLVALVLTVIVLGCASGGTQMVQVWYDEQFVPDDYQTIMVIALSSDQTRQRLFEDAMVAALTDADTRAFSSARLIPPNKEKDEALLRQVMQDQEATLVLTSRLISVDDEQEYVPGTAYSYPSYYGGGWYPYYYRTYDTVYTPGYVVSYKVVSLETTLHDVETEQLVWSGVSQTVDPSSVNQAIHSITDKVASDLRAAGIVK
jgi:hypothetical protein